jgi:tripartite-type tricarboxylate transporter receptor subunit TctC
VGCLPHADTNTNTNSNTDNGDKPMHTCPYSAALTAPALPSSHPPALRRANQDGARSKRRLAATIAVSAALLGVAAAAFADSTYPSKTVEVILPYAAGGGVDAMSRAFAREASGITGQSWVVSNRPGGAGIVGFSALANANPDGYTLVFSPASALTNSPFLVNKMPFKNEQIEPVCQVFENVFAIAVKSSSPIKSLDDLMVRAKAAPGTLSYGHAGPGSVPHLSVGAIEKALKVKFNGIGYRGDGQMLPDLLGGALDFGAPALSSLSGKDTRVLAVLSNKRHPSQPNVPSMTELGYPAVTPGLNGIYAPSRTPQPVLDKMEALCKQVVESDGFAKAAKGMQQVPAFLPRSQFKARIDATYRAHADLIPDLHLEKE